MTDITARVLGYIRKHALVRPGARVGVAVSGGADSVALLRIFLELRHELGAVLSVVHFNHKLRGRDSDADENFVRELAVLHNLDFHSGSGDTRTFAQLNKLSLETAARELRYAYFRTLITAADHPLDKIATAHTLDDQAETVLMRILRGTGPGGLAAIYPELRCGTTHTHERCHPERSEGSMHFAQDGEEAIVPHICQALAGVGPKDAAASASIVRPLLEIRRSEVEHYLRELHQPWRTDATNADLKHTRNRVRHELLPLLERDFNPALRDRLSELAEIARAEEDYWHEQVDRELLRLIAAAAPPQSEHVASVATERQVKLHLDLLSRLPRAVQRRVLRAAADAAGLTLDFVEVEKVLQLGDPATAAAVQLHDGWSAGRWILHTIPTSDGKAQSGRMLVLSRSAQAPEIGGYECVVAIPGEVIIRQTRTLFRARLVPLTPTGANRVKQRETPASDAEPSYTRSQLLNPQLLTQELLVRNWRPGDRFWPAHTSSPKKVKELLQQKRITGPVRGTWPVVVSGDEIVWMRGFPVPEKYRVPEGAETALLIEEEPFENG